MASKRKYWAVAYAHVIRWAGPCATATEAAKQAFGLVDTARMTVREFPSNPKYIPVYKRNEFLEALQKRHEEKTNPKEDEIRSICVVSDPVSEEVTNALDNLNREIRLRKISKGTEFYIEESMTENDRHSWEQIIRGLVKVM